MVRYNLIFDADDTLWESNIHFLEAEQEFVQVLRRAGCPLGDDELRALIRQQELEVIREHGYGRRPYAIALQRAIQHLKRNHSFRDVSAEIQQISSRLQDRHCEVRPAVRETLEELYSRNRLILFTKGQPDEQLGKLRASKLEGFFSHVEVAWEKDVNAYRALLEKLRLDTDRTVMIGNSPRSDINPAVRVGLRAIYLPHPQTWVYEQEEIDASDGRVITISRFDELRRMF